LDLGIIGHDEADAAFFLITPDDGFVGTADHLDDGAFSAPTAVEPGNPSQSTVTIEYQTHLRRAQEQVIAAIIGDQKTEAVAMTADTTADQVKLVHRGIGAAPGIDQLTVAFHRTQAAPQRLNVFLGVQPELFYQLLA